MSKSRPKVKRLGARIKESLEELRDALASGQPLESKFTVRTLEVPEPRPHDARSVRALRQSLGVSQAVFARLLGVSNELVEHWEQGIREPKPLARRLLDEISRDPKDYLRRHTTPSRPKVA
jgi:putative transcriptional regulator